MGGVVTVRSMMETNLSKLMLACFVPAKVLGLDAGFPSPDVGTDKIGRPHLSAREARSAIYSPRFSGLTVGKFHCAGAIDALWMLLWPIFEVGSKKLEEVMADEY